jgi:transketolase
MGINDISERLREQIININRDKQLPHVGSELSCLDVLVALHFNIMEPTDTFILSKGHAGIALYAVQHEKGLISDEIYSTLGQNGTMLALHTSYPDKSVKLGSLGNGLGIGAGIALSMKFSNKKGKVFVLLSDGELEEGSTFEAIWLSGRFNLDNLVGIVDYNKWQAYDRTDDILPISKTEKSIADLGWSVKHISYGNDAEKSAKELKIPANGLPTLFIAHTTLGKGLPNEDDLSTHYKPPK